MVSRKLPRKATAIAVVLLVFFQILGQIQIAHAATYIGYPSTACSPCTLTDGDNTVGAAMGEIVLAPFTEQLISVSFFTPAAGFPNANPVNVRVAEFNTVGTPASSTHTCNGGGTCVHLTTQSNVWTVKDSEALSGLTAGALNTVALAAPVSVTVNKWYFAGVNCSTASVNCSGGGHPYIINCNVTCSTVGSAGNIISGVVYFAADNPNVGSTGSSQNSGSNEHIGGATFSATVNAVAQIFQCYGNCGTTAVTLANTNSTHTVNWNTSITLFYIVQSQVNGFLLNITTSQAKTYLLTGNGAFFTVFTADCVGGASPGTASCPFLRQYINAFTDQPKGRVSNTLNLPITNGMWIALGISGRFNGFDLNDTNTNVAMQQVSGQAPLSISSYSSFSTGTKIGLWAWVTGNVVSGVPPTSPSLGYCAAIDCLLTALVNSACSVVSQQCTTGTALIFVVILTILSPFVLTKAIGSVGLTSRFPVGEFGLLLFVGWVFIFTGFSLLPVWVPVMFFMITAIMIAGNRGIGRYL